MAVQLDQQAQAFLANIQHRTGPIPTQIDAAIAKAAEGADKPLTLEQVQAAVEQALPDVTQQKAISKTLDQSQKAAMSYHSDGKRGSFLTQIIDMKITKEIQTVYRPAPRTRPVNRVRDPIDGRINMAPDADVVLLFNARDVDRNGQPLLLKVIAREGVDLEKYDLAQYRTKEGWNRDVQTVGAHDDVVTIKDVHEDEFQLGDPVKQVSLNPKGGELSTSVWIMRDNVQSTQVYQAKTVGTRSVPDTARPVGRPTVQQGENLDRQAVVSFTDRVRLELTAKDGADTSAWLNTRMTNFETTLHLDRGLIFEPNAYASVAFFGKATRTDVPGDDAQLLGSPAKQDVIDVGSRTLAQVLAQPIQLTTGTTDANNRAKPDRNAQNLPVSQIIYGLAEHVQVGGAQLKPLSDQNLNRDTMAAAGITATKRPLAGDGDRDGQQVTVKVDKGFVSSNAPASVDGWKIQVGFTDHEGKWHNVGEKTVKGQASAASEFKLDLADADQTHRNNRAFEVRVFNAEGIPAQRSVVNFDQVGWDPALRGGRADQA